MLFLSFGIWGTIAKMSQLIGLSGNFDPHLPKESLSPYGRKNQKAWLHTQEDWDMGWEYTRRNDPGKTYAKWTDPKEYAERKSSKWN